MSYITLSLYIKSGRYPPISLHCTDRGKHTLTINTTLTLNSNFNPKLNPDPNPDPNLKPNPKGVQLDILSITYHITLTVWVAIGITPTTNTEAQTRILFDGDSDLKTNDIPLFVILYIYIYISCLVRASWHTPELAPMTSVLYNSLL